MTSVSAASRLSRVAGDGAQEALPLERVQHQVGQRDDGRRPRHGAQEGHLAWKTLARPSSATGSPLPHLDAPGLDEVVSPRLALREDGLAGREEARLEAYGERLERRRCRGAKIGERLNNASARSGTTAAASIATSRVHVTPPATARNAPTPPRARPPMLIAAERNGTPTEPRARATSRSPSTAPKTRATRPAGRARSVSPAIATVVPAAPTTASKDRPRARAPATGRHEDERQAPERDPNPERARQPTPPPDNEGGRDAADGSPLS